MPLTKLERGKVALFPALLHRQSILLASNTPPREDGRDKERSRACKKLPFYQRRSVLQAPASQGWKKSLTATWVRFVHVRVFFPPWLPDQGCGLFIVTWRSALQLGELGLKVAADVDVSERKKEVQVRKASAQEAGPVEPRAWSNPTLTLKEQFCSWPFLKFAIL